MDIGIRHIFNSRKRKRKCFGQKICFPSLFITCRPYTKIGNINVALTETKLFPPGNGYLIYNTL